MPDTIVTHYEAGSGKLYKVASIERKNIYVFIQWRIFVMPPSLTGFFVIVIVSHPYKINFPKSSARGICSPPPPLNTPLYLSEEIGRDRSRPGLNVAKWPNSPHYELLLKTFKYTIL